MDDVNKTIARICDVPEFSPHDIAMLMYDLGLGEKAFAVVMNVELPAVRYWLSGAAKPSNVSRRLMQVLREVPCILECLVEDEDEDEG